MKSVAIILNPEKRAAVRLACELLPWFREHGVLVMAEHSSAAAMGEPSLSRDERLLATADFALVMGGDGTLLRASRTTLKAGVPMLPIRFGLFGFMTDVEPEEAIPALERVLEGRYGLDERMTLRATVHRDGKEIKSEPALNDMVISKGPLSRMLRLATCVSGKYISTYPADGVIVATPTGSTAYSLSAGGPIVAPNLKVLIVTPICPHTLNARALIVSSTETVDISVEDGESDVVLTIDGQLGMKLTAGDRVSIKDSGKKVKLITMDSNTFFDKLQTRLKWGERFCERQ